MEPTSLPPSDSTPLALAMILLRGERPLGVEAMKASLARRFPEVTVEAVEEDAPSDTTFTLLTGDGAGWTVSHMPGVVPAGDLERALALSPGIDADAPVLAHRTHLIVVSQGGALAPVERRSHLSIGVAAAADASDAVAVYWGEGSVLHEVADFVQHVQAEPIPVPLWFGVSVARPADDAIEFLSVGLRYVAHPDLLITARIADADDAFSFLYDCASYAIENGRTLRAGESIGISETHALAITDVESPVEPGVSVLSITYAPPR